MVLLYPVLGDNTWQRSIFCKVVSYHFSKLILLDWFLLRSELMFDISGWTLTGLKDLFSGFGPHIRNCLALLFSTQPNVRSRIHPWATFSWPLSTYRRVSSHEEIDIRLDRPSTHAEQPPISESGRYGNSCDVSPRCQSRPLQSCFAAALLVQQKNV